MKNEQKKHQIQSPNFESAFLSLFNKLVTIEEELDTLRELLNEEISFNLKDLYLLVANNSTSINYQHILNFLKETLSEKKKETEFITAIQSLIRYYNGNTSLNLSFSEFSSIFLNRQNRLLMKMTLQRESIGVLPNYILNFCKKILVKEIQLHLHLFAYRKSWDMQTKKLIGTIATQDEYIDELKLREFVKRISPNDSEKVNVEFQIFIRYLKPFSMIKVPKQLLDVLLLNKNSKTVEKFLKQKYKKHKKPQSKHGSYKTKKFIDPFIRSQFHDCLSRPKMTEIFSYRQIKSIQKHFNRINQSNGLINPDEITIKMKKFSTIIEKNCQKVLEAIKDILWLQKQIEYARVQLNLCPDFYPVLFFQCFHKDKQQRIIPSAMQTYFQQLGIKIPLSEIYLFFKRYAWYLQGKMDFNSFCSIFDVCQSAYSRIEKNRQVKSLADVDIETKKNFLLLLATIIKNEKRIDLIKGKLQKAKDMNLRDVFACFDSDDDGYLSITDFRIIWKKYLNLDVSKETINLLWFRMGYKDENQLIRYEQFIKQMVPKSNASIVEDKKLRKIKSQENIKFLNRHCSKTKKIK